MRIELVPYAPKGIWRPKGSEPDAMFQPIPISPELAERLSKLRILKDRSLAEVEERAIEAGRTNIARFWLGF